MSVENRNEQQLYIRSRHHPIRKTLWYRRCIVTCDHVIIGQKDCDGGVSKANLRRRRAIFAVWPRV